MKKTAVEVHRQVWKLFTYVSDKEQFSDHFDYWKSFADEAEAGKPFKGDCDDFCLTCAELLLRRGVQPELIRIVLVLTETKVGHLVCVCDDWVLDNRYDYVWPWGKLPYNWLKSMRLSERGTWREV